MIRRASSRVKGQGREGGLSLQSPKRKDDNGGGGDVEEGKGKRGKGKRGERE